MQLSAGRISQANDLLTVLTEASASGDRFSRRRSRDVKTREKCVCILHFAVLTADYSDDIYIGTAKFWRGDTVDPVIDVTQLGNIANKHFLICVESKHKVN